MSHPARRESVGVRLGFGPPRKTRRLWAICISSFASVGWACGAPPEPQAPTTTARASASSAAVPGIASATPSATTALPPSTPALSSAVPAPAASLARPSDGDPSAPDPAEAAALAGMSETQRGVLLAVKACTERALRANEEPKGSLAIELTVGKDGSVQSLKLADGYPPHMRACVEERVRQIPFQKGESSRFYRFPINETTQ